MTPSADPIAAVRSHALELGFDAVGFAPAALHEDAGRELKAFLDAGYHGDMGWMEARASQRASPKNLWPEAQSVIVVGQSYGPTTDPLATLSQREAGAVSVYAQGRDYHHVVKKRLRVLARWIAESFACEVKIFVDTAPVMEKPLAQAAGIGWQGKHTNLVSRQLGSWFFLGEVFTTLKLAPEEAEADHCGACRRCLDVCPTAAFPAPYRLDARRCISYLTIEHKGHIAREFRSAMGNRIYGCDDCLAVCPWNKFAKPAGDADLSPRTELTAPLLADLVRLDDAAFRALFAGSAVKRLGRDRFIRNVLIALGNSADVAQVGTIRPLLEDGSPLVRAMAVWALSRLMAEDELQRLRGKHLSAESDETVREEWQLAAA